MIIIWIPLICRIDIFFFTYDGDIFNLKKKHLLPDNDKDDQRVKGESQDKKQDVNDGQDQVDRRTNRIKG